MDKVKSVSYTHFVLLRLSSVPQTILWLQLHTQFCYIYQSQNQITYLGAKNQEQRIMWFYCPENVPLFYHQVLHLFVCFPIIFLFVSIFLPLLHILTSAFIVWPVQQEVGNDGLDLKQSIPLFSKNLESERRGVDQGQGGHEFPFPSLPDGPGILSLVILIFTSINSYVFLIATQHANFT